MRTSWARRGFTLIELVIATGLGSILVIALFRMVDVTLDLWSRGETRRELVEAATATGELLAEDLRALHNGQQGDLVADWWHFDADRDGVVDRYWPRLRLVRQAAIEDLVRLAEEEARARSAAQEGGRTATDAGPDPEPGPTPVESGLTEVVWAVLPASRSRDGRCEGVLMRGEARLEPGSMGRFLDPDFFSTTGEAPAGALREVTGGVLWLGVAFATQTTVLWDGWNLGPGLGDACASWDAWNRGRPDAELHRWNEPGAGMPAVEDRPLLPRRVRLELEFESERDRRRRTRLARAIDKEETRLEVEAGDALPPRAGAHLWVGGEWMELVRVQGDGASVRRGARGTEARVHETGEMVHWGAPVTLELPIVTHDDDWNLGGGRR